MFLFWDICWYLVIFVNFCSYVLIFVDICWYSVLFVVNVYWYLLISVDILWFLLVLSDLLWYLTNFIDIYWYLMMFVDICRHLQRSRTFILELLLGSGLMFRDVRLVGEVGVLEKYTKSIPRSIPKRCRCGQGHTWGPKSTLFWGYVGCPFHCIWQI